MALSTAEAELIACSEASREAIWLRNLLQEIVTDLNFTSETVAEVKMPVHLLCDNQSALNSIIKGCVNPSGRNKHIEIRFYHAREMQEQGIIDFMYVKSEWNVADILTKALPVKRHMELVAQLNMKHGADFC